jgi:hypothetical protein
MNIMIITSQMLLLIQSPPLTSILRTFPRTLDPPCPCVNGFGGLQTNRLLRGVIRCHGGRA